MASGRSLRQRLGLEAAFAAVARGEADGPIVSKLDRLSRSVGDFSNILARFQRNSRALVVMDLGVDTSTIMRAAMAQMVSMFSELERQRIGERTKEALAAKKARGDKLARPASIPPVLAKRIQRMRARGMTLQGICDVLNDEGVPTARGGALWRPTSLRAVLA